MRQFARGLEGRIEDKFVDGNRIAAGALAAPPRTEHEIQREYFATLTDNAPIWPEFDWVFAIPNAGAGAQSGQAGKMRAEGVKAGVPDVFIPFCRKGYGGCWLEFKAADGTMSPAQKAWGEQLHLDYRHEVVRDGAVAFWLTCVYLGVPTHLFNDMTLRAQWRERIANWRLGDE